MRADDSDLLLALHRSVQQIPVWQGFLDALAQRTIAHSAHILVQREGQPPQRFGEGALPFAIEAFARMRYLRPYSGDDIAAPLPFRALRSRAEGGGDVWIIVCRQGDDFAAATSALLSGLAPHLALAAGQFWRHQQALTRHSVAQDMAARHGLGWVLLGADAQVILADNTLPADVVLADKLRLPAPALRQITRRIAAYTASETQLSLAINLPQTQAILVPFANNGAAAILYVQTPKAAPLHAWHVLADLFGLTRNEARFAAELAQGKSISQAGQALGFTVETARYYSKQLYVKLGAAGQADVVVRIKNSVYTAA